MIGISKQCSTCLLENEISNKLCDKFSIAFKLRSYGDDDDYFDFYIGYATADSIDESIKDWNRSFGEYDNDQTSWGWIIFDDELLHSGDGHSILEIDKGLDYSLGDLVRISFNFILICIIVVVWR